MSSDKSCIMKYTLQQKLTQAIVLEQTWTPSIYMPLDSCNSIEDLVPMLKPTSSQEASFSTKQYPKGASFHFYGYSGTASSGDLMDAIKKASEKYGTKLKARRRAQSSDSRKELIEFFCVKHHHNTCLGAQDFQPHYIQQCGTIIQPKNQAHSAKGSSRSAKLKNFKPLNNDNNTSIRKNKTTSIKPINYANRCPFKFYVFLSTTDDLWYLSYNSISCKHMLHKNITVYRKLPNH